MSSSGFSELWRSRSPKLVSKHGAAHRGKADWPQVLSSRMLVCSAAERKRLCRLLSCWKQLRWNRGLCPNHHSHRSGSPDRRQRPAIYDDIPTSPKHAASCGRLLPDLDHGRTWTPCGHARTVWYDFNSVWKLDELEDGRNECPRNILHDTIGHCADVSLAVRRRLSC